MACPIGLGTSSFWAYAMYEDFSTLPIIDIAPLVAGSADKQYVAARIDAACRQSGFFYVIGHGVDTGLQRDLQTVAHQFFARPTAEKMRIEMSRGGKAWRGYFRLGDELTSGRPDQKELGAAPLRTMVNFAQTVDGRGKAGLSRLDLQGQVQRIMP
jgi:isopenicillin N synthase-like dioxygenase